MSARLLLRLTAPLLLGSLHGLGAADYYVSPKGLDTNPGSLAQPWKTIQKAATTLAAGDTVFLRKGTYKELVTVGVSGGSGRPVTFRNYASEKPVIDGAGKVPPGTSTGLILIQNRSNIVIQGIELRNYRTTDENLVPAGVFIEGACANIELRGNNIHHISNTHVNGNAFGIAVYGSSGVQAVTGLVIDGNDVHHLKTGNSESVVINGNVEGFEVTLNRIHDNNNIGIDFIGFEGTCPDANLDRARNGICRANRVWNISSRSNRSYHGEMSADGIYCDGAKDITVERNVVWYCDIGIELASEAAGGSTTGIVVRENFVYRNRITGLALGGYEAGLGSTSGCTVSNNTFFSNDTTRSGSGEILLQYNVSGNTFKQNIIHAWTQGLMLGSQVPLGAGNVFSRNFYFMPRGDDSADWEWAGASFNGLAAWTTAGPQEQGALFANPLFVKTATGNLRLKAGSTAIDSGDPAFVAGIGETDVDGNARVVGAAVDRGALEFAPQ